MTETFKAAQAHKGTSSWKFFKIALFLTIKLLNPLLEGKSKTTGKLYLEDGKPLTFGENGQKGIKLSGLTPEIVNTDDIDPSDLMVYTIPSSNAAHPTLLLK